MSNSVSFATTKSQRDRMYRISNLFFSLHFVHMYKALCRGYNREYNYIYLCIKIYFGIYLPRELYCLVHVCLCVCKYCE